ncbi:MAG TPA: type VII secretion target [Pseudonocardiaceae bacterium]
MAGSDGFQVSASELRTHAGSVQQAAATVGQALAAAQQVTLDTGAYGLICGPLFVPIVQQVTTPGLAALGQAESSLNSVADALTQTADSYSGTDADGASALAALDGQQ